MSRLQGSSEGNSLKTSQDESRAPADPIPLDVIAKLFTASFKESNESTKQHFDYIDQRFNEIIDHMVKCLMEQDPRSVEMKEDHSRDC